MPYSDRDYKVSNVNYLNKDFNSLKSKIILQGFLHLEKIDFIAELNIF